MPLTRRRLLAATAAAGALAVTPLRAQSALPVKMILNWRYQGPQGWFFLAQDRGYFADAGVEMTLDQGSGSGAAVGSVAGGGYDMGFGDINALIQLAAENPGAAPIGVYMMYNRPPFTVAVMADSDIHDAKDLEGRKLGGAANDGALKLWPAFAEVAGIDASGVEILNFQPNLREQMLRTRQVEGVFGYVNTIRFSAMLSGMDPDKEIRFINYGDYGMDLYSNALIVSKALAAEKPEQVRGVVAAINQGVKDTLADPDAAIEAVYRGESLIDKPVEKARLFATLQDEMGHPEIARLGLGMPDPARLKSSIDLVVNANRLSRTPSPEEIFTDAFLPPMADRITALG